MTPETRGQYPEEMETRPEEQDRKTFVERETVNGIVIHVAWDSSCDSYVIYFPQIERLSEAIPDQLIMLTSNPEVAKQVFDFATEEAKETQNVYDLYESVNWFFKDLPNDDEE